MAAPIQTLPRVDNVELAPAAGSGFAPDGVDDVVCIAGPCPRGPYTPSLIGASDVAALVAAYGVGPAVKEAIYAMANVALPLYFLRLPTAAVAGVLGTLTITSATLATFGAIAGTPTDGADVLITCSTTGTTGTSFSYTLSLDGGVTTGSPVSVTTALTIVVLGVTLTLTTGKVFTSGDTIAWLQTVASSTVLPTTIAGAGSSVVTVTGTPLDAYEVAFKVIAGGTIGTAGITYQYSLDYGAPSPTWSAVTSLSTAVTLLLLDGAAESSGLTLNFAAGTLPTAYLIVFSCSSPAYDSTGATSGLAALRKAGVSTWVRMVGPVTKALGSTVDGIISGYGTTAKPMWGVVDCRDRATHETLAAWSARINAEWLSYTSTYVGYAEGMARISCPVTGRNNRRSAMAVCTPRAMAYPIFVDFGEFDLGPLASDVTLQDVNGVTVELDANADPSGVVQGAICLRSWPGYVGVYPAKACLPGPAGNIQRIPVRRVFNVGEIIFLGVLQSQALKNFRVAKTGAPKPEIAGQLYKSDQAKFNRLGNDALTRGIVDAGLATSCTFAVNPTPISLGGDSYKIKASFGLGAFIYADVLSGTSQLV